MYYNKYIHLFQPKIYFKNAKIEFTSFPRLLFQLYGRKDSWIIQIKNKENQISKLEIKAIPVIEYETNRNGEVVNPQKKLKFYGNNCILKRRVFWEQ